MAAYDYGEGQFSGTQSIRLYEARSAIQPIKTPEYSVPMRISKDEWATDQFYWMERFYLNNRKDSWIEAIPQLKDRPASEVKHYVFAPNNIVTHCFLESMKEANKALLDNYVLYDVGRASYRLSWIASPDEIREYFEPEWSWSDFHYFKTEKITAVHKRVNGNDFYWDETAQEWTAFTTPPNVSYPDFVSPDPVKYPYIASFFYKERMTVWKGGYLRYIMNDRLHVIPESSHFQMTVKTHSYIIGKTPFKAAVLSWTYHGTNIRSSKDLESGDEIIIQIKKVGEPDSAYKQIGSYVSSQALILGLDPTTEYNIKGIYTTNGHKIRKEIGYVAEVNTTNTLSEDSTQSRKKRATLSSWDPNATVEPPTFIDAKVVGKMAKVSWVGSASQNISHYVVKCAFYKDVTSTADGVTRTDAVLVHRDEVEVAGESPSYLILFTETGNNMRCLVNITAVNYALVESQPNLPADIIVFPE